MLVMETYNVALNCAETLGVRARTLLGVKALLLLLLLLLRGLGRLLYDVVWDVLGVLE